MISEFVEFAIVVPGAVAANTNIDLPGYVGKVSQLVAAYKVTLSDGTASGAISSLTVVTGTPGAGQIQLVDEDTIQLGDATTALDLLILVYIPKGSVSGA